MSDNHTIEALIRHLYPQATEAAIQARVQKIHESKAQRQREDEKERAEYRSLTGDVWSTIDIESLKLERERINIELAAEKQSLPPLKRSMRDFDACVQAIGNNSQPAQLAAIFFGVIPWLHDEQKRQKPILGDEGAVQYMEARQMMKQEYKAAFEYWDKTIQILRRELTERGHATKPPAQLKARAYWLQALLDSRMKSKHDLARESELAGHAINHKTIQKILDEKSVQKNVLNKLARVLNIDPKTIP